MFVCKVGEIFQLQMYFVSNTKFLFWHIYSFYLSSFIANLKSKNKADSNPVLVEVQNSKWRRPGAAAL